MTSAFFRFHAELNDFLPARFRQQTLAHTFDRRASIKDMVESLNVPHTEVDLLVINGVSVDFDAIVQSEDRIDVYPVQGSAGVTLANRVVLRPPFPGRARFVLDTHLGRLSSYLRMLGFDTLYRNDYADDELARVADEETRILLTRDLGLLKRGRVVYGYFVRATEARARLLEVTRRFNLLPDIQPFRHCLKCNGLVTPVSKAQVLHSLPGDTAQIFDEFHRCDRCGQVFWKGSHYARMQRLLDDVFSST